VIDLGEQEVTPFLSPDVPGTTRVAPPVQEVGASPGDGGSRLGLLQRQPWATPATVTPVTIMSDAEARVAIDDARAAGMVLVWRAGFAKSGRSQERYVQYSKALTFAQLDACRRHTYLSAITGADCPVLLAGNLVNDVARRICTFRSPDVPPVLPAHTSPAPSALSHADVPPVLPAHTSPAPSALSPAVMPTHSAIPDAAALPTPPAAISAPSTWSGTLRQRPGPGLGSAAVLGIPLDDNELELLNFTRRQNSTAHLVDVPHRIMQAAIGRIDPGLGGTRVPRSVNEAQRSPAWPSYRAAIEKELSGFMEMRVWDEVDRSSLPADTLVLPTQVIFAHKFDGTVKARIVMRGDLSVEGVHYLESRSSMISQESFRMLVSFCAGSAWALHSIDFTQAFINVPEDNPHMYCELPDIPPEMRGARFGSGRGKKVAHMKRMLYGGKSASRSWADYLLKFFVDKLGVRVMITDRCLFEWEWNGHKMIAGIFVDDIIFGVSDDSIRHEFVRRVAAEFKITGGELVEEYCGIEITRNSDNSVTLSQRAFAKGMLDAFGMWGSRPEHTPMWVGAPELEKWECPTTDRDTFDYMMFMGDLAWYSRTNPALAFVVRDLARYMQNPGPEHIVAAKHVLRYILGTYETAGITYHRNSGVLDQSYPHRHVMVGASDASFAHTGGYAISGLVVLMNGGPIMWRSKAQSTPSNTTTEAEVKAMTLCVEACKKLLDLWAEVARVEHGMMRIMCDSEGAIAQAVNGQDHKRSATYKRSQLQFYVEHAAAKGMVWFDAVPGTVNPADVFTKQVRNHVEFNSKIGVATGTTPQLFESAAVAKIKAGLTFARREWS